MRGRKLLTEDEKGSPSSGKKKRPWWARPDHEMISDRVDHLKEIYLSRKVEVKEEDRDALVREAARRDPRIRNLLDTVPVKRKAPEKKDEFLLVPKFDTERGEKIARTLKIGTRRRIRLDDFGWSVWELIDGKRDVREIGKLLKEEHGEKVEPLYPRLARFLAYLDNLKLVKIKKKGK